MGGETFEDKVKGATAEVAFREAVKNAQWQRGHGGYTGTIAEKDSFVTIKNPMSPDGFEDRREYERAVRRYSYSLIEKNDERINDKWGPAGCIDLGDGEYLFFGWASS